MNTISQTSSFVPLAEAQAARIHGNRGIWVGIFCVLVEFTVLFSVYFIARVHSPEEFRVGPDRLMTLAGVAITLLLLTSGYCMAKAVQVIRCGRHRAAAAGVLAAIVLGFGYPAIKFFELHWYMENGIGGRPDIFYGTYYYLTLNHLVHVRRGLLGLMWVGGRAAFGGYTAGNLAAWKPPPCIGIPQRSRAGDLTPVLRVEVTADAAEKTCLLNPDTQVGHLSWPSRASFCSRVGW